MIRATQPAFTERTSRRLAGWLCAALLATAAFGGCSSNGGTPPDNLRYGQVGEVEVELRVPLRLGEGSLYQLLIWQSNGAWELRESIGYRGLAGDENTERNEGDPSPLAAGYASFVTMINEVEGLELFIDELDPDTIPECGSTRTTISFTIRDDARNEETRWVRCADGSLSNITPVGAGPDPAASRVVSAAQLARNATLGEDFLSAYHGSVPFGTLDRGDNTNSGLTEPAYVLTEQQWQAFWVSHKGGGTPPAVDFESEMVVVAAVGMRSEAGDSVEVRRVLQVDNGTLTEVYERLPGDFCSPAARSHVPYHIVVAPRTPLPARFAAVRVERVPCGG